MTIWLTDLFPVQIVTFYKSRFCKRKKYCCPHTFFAFDAEPASLFLNKIFADDQSQTCSGLSAGAFATGIWAMQKRHFILSEK